MTLDYLRGNIEYLLAELLRHLAVPSLQAAVMLPRRNRWYTAVDLGLTEAQQWVEFDSDGFAWLSLAALYPEPVWMPLNAELIAEMLQNHDPRDYECFKDLAAVAAVPINHPRTGVLIGILVVYAPQAHHWERVHPAEAMEAAASLMAPLISVESAIYPAFLYKLLRKNAVLSGEALRALLSKHQISPQTAPETQNTFSPFNPFNGATVEVEAVNLAQDLSRAEQLREAIMERRQQLQSTSDTTDRARLTQILRALEEQEQDIQKQTELAKQILKRDDTAQV